MNSDGIENKNSLTVFLNNKQTYLKLSSNQSASLSFDGKDEQKPTARQLYSDEL